MLYRQENSHCSSGALRTKEALMMSSYYVSPYGGGDVVQTDHYHAPAPVHGVSVATGHVVGAHHHAGGFDAGPYDPSRVYHLQQHNQQHHLQHAAAQQPVMGQNFNQQQSYGRYPPSAGYIQQQANKTPDGSQSYFNQHQHIRSQQQSTGLVVVGPEVVSSQQAHLYRPASPMISAMAPQHGSPPLSYTGVGAAKPLVPCAETSSTSLSTSPHSQQQLGGNMYGAGHPSFQAQHHRTMGNGQQQQQHLMTHQQYLIQQQQQHSMTPQQQSADPSGYSMTASVEGYPAPDMASYQQQQQPPPPQQAPQQLSPVMYNSGRSNNGFAAAQQVCHAQMAPSQASSEPVIADLDQLQQQQRQQQQQQQQQLCAINGKPINSTPTDGSSSQNALQLIHSNMQPQPAVEPEPQQTPNGQQQQRHPIHSTLVIPNGQQSAPQQQTIVLGSDDLHQDLHGEMDMHGSMHGDMMDHHLSDMQHSPLDGSEPLPPLMDGESPSGDMQDSPLYPWMRSQFGKCRYTAFNRFETFESSSDQSRPG